jgi:hypothetical protein
MHTPLLSCHRPGDPPRANADRLSAGGKPAKHCAFLPEAVAWHWVGANNATTESIILKSACMFLSIRARRRFDAIIRGRQLRP